MASRLPTHSILAIAALGAVALAGCGGDTRRAEGVGSQAAPQGTVSVPHVKVPHGPAVSAAPADPARRAYLAKADRVCARFDPKRNEARKRAAGEAADPTKAARTYDEGVKVGDAQLRALEAIPVPSGDRALLRANVVAPLRAQLALRRDIATALSGGDVTEIRTLQARVDNLTRSLEGFARGYGYRVCGTG